MHSGLQGKLIILSAPSGSGKTTVKQHLLGSRHDLDFSVSATTRGKRPNEVHGRDYYFISQEEFRRKIEDKDFVEWEEVYPGTFYGTLKEEVQRIWSAGRHVVFDVDVIGGLRLKQIYGGIALDVFIKPPDLKILEERLRKRNTEPDEKIEQRISKAAIEMNYADEFTHIITNDDLERTLDEVGKLVNHFLSSSQP